MHRGLTSLLAATGLVLTGCGSAEPQVTFYSHGTSVEVAPARYCDPSGEHCAPPKREAVGKLRVPSHEPLQISVPGEVADAPWQVAFIYRTPSGEEIRSRTPVFPPNQRYAYTLTMPQTGAHLEYVEVQKYSGMLVPSPEGGVEFALAGSWALDVS